MIIEKEITIVPNDTYEPTRDFLIINTIEHDYAYDQGGELVERYYNELHDVLNGDVDQLIDNHVDEFWKILKERTMKHFDQKFLGWIKIGEKVIDFLYPLELWQIDYYISKRSQIDYESDKPVKVIMYFESV